MAFIDIILVVKVENFSFFVTDSSMLARVFVPGKHFQAGLIFEGKAYVGEHLKGTPEPICNC